VHTKLPNKKQAKRRSNVARNYNKLTTFPTTPDRYT